MITQERPFTATPVIKNKFWIVEHQGKKIATIQAIEEGGFAYVTNSTREKFPTINSIKKRYRINILSSNKKKQEKKHANEIYGYPTIHKPYGQIFDVKKKLPIYSRTTKSKSYYCAGYYLVKIGSTWIRECCPKLLTLNRHTYLGPFATEHEQQKALENL